MSLLFEKLSLYFEKLLIGKLSLSLTVLSVDRCHFREIVIIVVNSTFILGKCLKYQFAEALSRFVLFL